jgi:hypothetical protein
MRRSVAEEGSWYRGLVRRLPLAAALSRALLAGVTPAPARAAGGDAAREQFRDGVALMTAGDFAGALTKFKAVARVKMNAQVAFNIAECEEHLGRLVSALGNYRLAAQKAQDGTAPQVASVVDARIDALDKRIPRLTLKRVEPTPNPRALVVLDGNDVAPAQIGKPLSVDPGERVVSVVAGGKTIGTSRVTLAEGEQKVLEVTIPAPKADDAGGGTEPPPPPPTGPSVPGIVLTSAGGVSLVVGFVAIGVRQAAIADLDAVCSANHVCPTSAKPTADRGKLMTGLAEVTIPVGVVAATTGIVLLVTHAKGAKKAPTQAALPLGPTGEGGRGLYVAPGAPSADGPGVSLRASF